MELREKETFLCLKNVYKLQVLKLIRWLNGPCGLALKILKLAANGIFIMPCFKSLQRIYT